MATAVPLVKGTTTPMQEMQAGDTFPRANVPGATVISPSQITADQDNYNPTGLSTADLIRLDFDADGHQITGVVSWSDGKAKTFVNVGSNYGVFATEHPDSTAANRIAGTSDWLFPPGASITMIPDATTSRIRVLATSFNENDLGLRHRGVYVRATQTSATEGDNPHTDFTTSGTGAAIANKLAGSGVPKGLALQTGTTSTGAAAVSIPKDSEGWRWDLGHKIFWCACYLPALSTSGQRFSADAAISLINGTSAALPDRSSVGFRYSDNLNIGKWQLYTFDVSQVQATADSGITVAANTMYYLCAVVDKSLTEARFFINGSYVGRISTNMPAAAQNANARLVIVKSVGTTSTEAVLTDIGYAVLTN